MGVVVKIDGKTLEMAVPPSVLVLVLQGYGWFRINETDSQSPA